MRNHLLFLGTGTSHGVPVIGCDCAVCKSTDPRNTRTRTSALLKIGSKRILIDPSIDFRQQALRQGIDRIDAVLITHPHADHIFGLDELRIFTAREKKAISVFASPETMEEMRQVFGYAFSPPQQGGGVPLLDFQTVDGVFSAADETITSIPIKHGLIDILGFRHRSLAYLTDCSEIPEESWALLDGVEVLVLDALRFRPHPTHFNVQQAQEVVDRLKPRKTYFIHICHDLEHEAVSLTLPDDVELAYDGLEIEF